MPFSDDEIKRIIEACDKFSDSSWVNMHGKGVWTSDDVRDFIWVMLYTGLRISDVCFFDMSRLKANEVFLRAKKNGGDVFAYIPDWLRDRLNVGQNMSGNHPFLITRSERLETITNMWRPNRQSV